MKVKKPLMKEKTKSSKLNAARKKVFKNVGSKPRKEKMKNYSSMSVDEFMDKEIERSSSEENETLDDDIMSDGNGNEFDLNINNRKDNSDSDMEQTNEFDTHKISLAKLRNTDPEFYKFLEENDKKLLQFNESDVEDDEQESEDEIVHKPEDSLEVASDESDFEPEDGVSDNKAITLKLLKSWQKDIHTDKTTKTIKRLIKAFNAALTRISNEEPEQSNYKVDGSSVFNAVVQICVLELGPALRRFLRLPQGSKQPPHKCKRFAKIKSALQGYLLDLFKLLGGVSSTNIQTVLLKHLHYMSSFLTSYTNVSKKMLKRLIHLWGTADQTVRVLAFMCILRITNTQKETLLDTVLKSMYMTYVQNSKFMSTGTLPEINFMRRSLTEMYALDVNVSYSHVFLYIRQLAIHLRSAVTVHKKENMQAVYNWQFINSIHLWANLLTITCNKTQLQPLIYPLVQVVLGTIKLISTAQYFPLRFHCLQILMNLSRDTNIFIPILPFLVEILTNFDFNKKHKKVSMKPIKFTCILRVSKSQMMENGFKDSVIDSVYGLLLECLSNQSHTISFPDLALLCSMQIKQFLKKCSIANYCKKMRQILDKIDQNVQFIEKERKNISFNISDFKQIDAWETTIKNKGTPLKSFFDNWNKLQNINKRKQVTNNDKLGDYNLPQLIKPNKKVQREKGELELLPSDSESDEELKTKLENLTGKQSKKIKNESKPPKKKESQKTVSKIKQKKGNLSNGVPEKNINQNMSSEDEEEMDIVEDLKVSDW